MQPKLTESEGARLLREEFVRAGFEIVEGAPFEAGGAVLSLDGYDAGRRVGFEFVTAEAGDRKAYGPEVVAALEEKMERGEAYLLLVDEWDAEGADDLVVAARRFLDQLRVRGVQP